MTTDVIGSLTFLETPTVSGVPVLLNAGGVPSVQAGVNASKPAAGTTGRIYVSSDTQSLYYDSGSSWVLIGSGAGASGVSSFNTRTGAVTLTATDVTNALTFTPLGTNGGTLTNSLYLAAGSPTSPSVAFQGTQTGLYEVSSNILGFTAGGTGVGYMTSTGLNSMAIGASTPSTGTFTSLSASTVNAGAGSISSPSFGFTGTQTGLYEVSSNILGFTAGGTGIGYMTSTGLNSMAVGASTPSTGNFTYLTSTYTVGIGAGSASGPSLFFNSTNTGLYEVGSTAIGFSAGGTGVGYVSNTGLNGMVIGASSPTAGTFTTLTATALNNTPIGSGTPNSGAFTSLSTNNASITGGNINGTTIGGSSAAGGTFSTLNSSTLSTSNATITGGNITNTSISGSSGSFTTLTASSFSISAINNTPVGPSNPSTGAFTTLSSSGLASLSSVVLAAGTAATAPATLTSGTVLTTPVAGALEYDGSNLYATLNTASGRGLVPVEQYYHLTSIGSTISNTATNFFGANTNPTLVASGYYDIEIIAFFLKTTSGTVTWTLTNSAAPTSQNIHYEASPTSGIVAPPGATTTLEADVYNNTSAIYTFTTGSLSTGANHTARFRIWLQNGSGTSLKIQAQCSAGTITPGSGSMWTCKRIPSGNTGTFAA